MNEKNKKGSLKIFFIKLISVSLAIIFIINILFNLIVADKFEMLLSISELETRRELGDKMRENIKEMLEKDNLIKKEDKILLYKLYQKIKSEFEDIK
tara:strand:+ start:705 stop:995 length:291 start_codon:yes stop_codon:yes gene_type:complete